MPTFETEGPFGKPLDGVARAYQEIHRKTLEDARKSHPTERLPADPVVKQERVDEAKKKWTSEKSADRKFKKGLDKALWRAELDKDKKKEKVKEETKPLNVSTPTAEAIAKKHKLSVDEVNRRIEVGANVEKEHTTQLDAAKEIARDHLNERPDYYEKLKKMEKLPQEEMVNEVSFGKLERYSDEARKVLQSYGKETPKGDLSIYGDSKREQAQGARYEKFIGRERKNRKAGLMLAYLKMKARARVPGSYDNSDIIHTEPELVGGRTGNKLVSFPQRRTRKEETITEHERRLGMRGDKKDALVAKEMAAGHLVGKSLMQHAAEEEKAFAKKSSKPKPDKNGWYHDKYFPGARFAHPTPFPEETVTEAVWPKYDVKKIGGGELRSTTIPKEKVPEYTKDVVKKGVAAGKFLKQLQQDYYAQRKAQIKAHTNEGRRYYGTDYPDDDYEGGDIEFADPGGRSALRAATRDNPRIYPCPSCGSPNRLTKKDVQLGYQCDTCADKAERGLGPED